MERLTPEIVRRHDRPGPRYTSYPTADRFHEGFGAEGWAAALERAGRRGAEEPLSLYVHMPFCQRACTYCACNMVATRSEERMATYLDHLLEELRLVGGRLGARRRLAQLHFGGGTPNWLPVSELARVMAALRGRFELEPDAEVAIETDPRHATVEQMHALRDLGFNRVSVGVQDFDPQVQQAVGRRQGYELTAAVVAAARSAGFESLNMDLVYGLPLQTEASFAATLDKVLGIAPDRIAIFSFAYVPWMAPGQRKIPEETLPDPDVKLALFCEARERFLAAGYQAIGMDHFARPGDVLARALRERRLHRNFQGYTVAPHDRDFLGLGVTAIGDVAGAYAQNHKDIKAYQASVAAGRLPVARGYELTPDDLARRWIIEELMCAFQLRFDALREATGLEPGDLAPELRALEPLAAQGLVVLHRDGVDVTPLGQLFVRVVAMVFDRHLRERPPERPAYSRTV